MSVLSKNPDKIKDDTRNNTFHCFDIELSLITMHCCLQYYALLFAIGVHWLTVGHRRWRLCLRETVSKEKKLWTFLQKTKRKLRTAKPTRGNREDARLAFGDQMGVHNQIVNHESM